MKGIPESCRDFLSYDPDSGTLSWKKSPCSSVRAGDKAESETTNGYLRCYHKGHLMVHRVCWFLYYGEQPPEFIDHINGNRKDNRIENLRPCTRKENNRNNGPSSNSQTGVKGVSPFRGKFRASITVDRKHKHLGVFSSIEEAKEAYEAASREYFGEFHRETH